MGGCISPCLRSDKESQLDLTSYPQIDVQSIRERVLIKRVQRKFKALFKQKTKEEHEAQNLVVNCYSSMINKQFGKSTNKKPKKNIKFLKNLLQYVSKSGKIVFPIQKFLITDEINILKEEGLVNVFDEPPENCKLVLPTDDPKAMYNNTVRFNKERQLGFPLLYPVGESEEYSLKRFLNNFPIPPELKNAHHGSNDAKGIMYIDRTKTKVFYYYENQFTDEFLRPFGAHIAKEGEHFPVVAKIICGNCVYKREYTTLVQSDHNSLERHLQAHLVKVIQHLDDMPCRIVLAKVFEKEVTEIGIFEIPDGAIFVIEPWTMHINDFMHGSAPTYFPCDGNDDKNFNSYKLRDMFKKSEHIYIRIKEDEQRDGKIKYKAHLDIWESVKP